MDKRDSRDPLAGGFISFAGIPRWGVRAIPSKAVISKIALELLGLANCTSSADREKASEHAKILLALLGGGGFKLS